LFYIGIIVIINIIIILLLLFILGVASLVTGRCLLTITNHC